MKAHAPVVAMMLAAVATLSAQAVSEAANAGVLLCGGVGSGERDALAAQARGANLQLEFFIARRGNYVADVDVTLTPLDGARDAHPVRVNADGPLCYIGVKPGRYRVDAEFNGVTRSARATVPAEPARPVRVAIAFPESAAHGDLDIRPTPEEKQEAKTP